MEIKPIILAGGVGSRLWPLSRSAFPKPFFSFIGNKTLFQQTLERTKFLKASSLIICGEAHRFLVLDQLEDSNYLSRQILLEPMGKSTAPALALASLLTLREEEESILLVMPADHYIENHLNFQAAVQQAQGLALDGYIVTFGCTPEFPNTEYGYIKAGTPFANGLGYSVHAFIEKPTAEIAQHYVQSGEYYWNSGIFMMRASVYLAELAKYQADILATCCKAFENIQFQNDFFWLNKKEYALCPELSIDYAIMEKTKKAALIPLNVGWNDIGTWRSLQFCSEKTPEGNNSQGDVYVHNVENSLIHASHRTVAAVGVKDHIIVETRDAVLVAHKNAAHEVKSLVQQFTAKQHEIVHNPSQVHRPWGTYEVLENAQGFRVKKIRVKPQAQLSLQYHQHRSEHWVVVKGKAEVIRDKEKFFLSANESTYIPPQTIHRLGNPTTEILEIIEIQCGSYLEEDDIVRLEDDYARTI